MSFGRSDPIRSLILHGSPSGFSRPAEGWAACSNDDILTAAAKQLGVLQQRREYRDNAGQARANWQQHGFCEIFARVPPRGMGGRISRG